MISVQALAMTGLTIWLVYCAVLITYRLFFHPLASFPGRKLAAATRWYEFYYDCLKGDGGEYMWEVDQMHEKYGECKVINCQPPSTFCTATSHAAITSCVFIWKDTVLV